MNVLSCACHPCQCVCGCVNRVTFQVLTIKMHAGRMGIRRRTKEEFSENETGCPSILLKETTK